MSVRILIGDCRETMKALPDASVDSVVCDPPYHLTAPGKSPRSNLEQPKDKDLAAINAGSFRRLAKGFMGQTWDGGDVAFDPDTWAEVLRVLKPGGHMVAFSGSRTYHRMTCAIEDAGFEIRDQIFWVYSTGFPKSHNVSEKLKGSLPVDALCACARDCQQTIPSSQSGCPTYRDCDDARPLDGSDSGPGAPPSQADAPTHSLSLLHGGDLGEGSSHNRLSSSGRLSSADCPPLASPPSGASLAGDSESSGTSSNKSSGGLRAGHKSHHHTPGTPHLVGGSASSSSETPGYDNVNLPRCETCGKIVVPQGLGTALKPSHEPICLARKPLIGTVAQNCLTYGTGALNIDGCRIETDETLSGYHGRPPLQYGGENHRPFHDREEHPKSSQNAQGRWPANLCHDGSEEVLAGFPETGPAKAAARGGTNPNPMDWGNRRADGDIIKGHDDEGGSAARFFYCAKATTDERGEGNNHPTVKPVALMRWLVRLVTPKGGTVLDPFMGSGSTLLAAEAEQFNAIGCELSPDYAAIAERRIREASGLFANVTVSRMEADDEPAEAAA